MFNGGKDEHGEVYEGSFSRFRNRFGLVTFSIVQEIEDRRTYWLLYQSDNKRMKMLSDQKNLESSLLPIIKENLDKEREVLNGDSDF